jgi:hypothetical protein
MSKIGEVEKICWFELETNEIVTFHTALFADGGSITFFSDRKTWPSSISALENLEYKLLRVATDSERENFLLLNPLVQVRRVIEI